MRRPPLEAPHHSASIAALVGGGSRVLRPGAIARATHGVLFLDEVGEFAPSVLDALRQPLEKGEITIHRAGVTASFPASFQLILATNPCPCGNYGVRGGSCVCAPMAIRRYLGRLSGPLLDRVDIELGLARVSVAHASDLAAGAVTTAAAAERVAEARDASGISPARHAVAPERPRLRSLAARRTPRTSPRRAPADRRRAAPRLIDTARL